jgi:hypothetical protein
LGIQRSTGRGSHQLLRPSSRITAGTSSIRTTVASTRIAADMPIPKDFMVTSSSAISAAKTTIMMVAAAVITRPVPARPVRMARSLSWVRTQVSRIRLIRKTS